MRSVLGVTFLAMAVAACSSSAPSGPCALRQGNYKGTLAPQGQSCGDVAPEVVAFHETSADPGTTGAPPGCDGEIAVSKDNCSQEIHSKCFGADMDGSLAWSEDGRGGSGLVTIAVHDRSGSLVTCRGQYILSYEKL